jgi:DNA-binding NarL/FixJ family response regulator
MKKTILVFSALIIALLVLFQLGRYTLLSGDTRIELVVAIIAVIFFFVGVFINKKTLQSESNETKEIDLKKIQQLEISKREYQVLELISKGLSNKEIAERLFLSESTIKTHVSSLLVKLDAKRRTQAIQIAKQLHLI